MAINNSVTMLTKLPLALVFLLSVSILAAAQLRDSKELHTAVPYYMRPYIWAIGGGVAPAKVGNEDCPSAVKLTPEIYPGVPVVFSASTHGHESVVIDDETDVYISFNTSNCSAQKTWGFRFSSPLPSELTLELVTEARIYVPIRFRIWREGAYYRVYSSQFLDTEGNELVYNLAYSDDSANGLRRLVLTSDQQPKLLFLLIKAEDYSGMIRTVA